MYIPSLVFKSARNRIAKYCHHPLSCSKFTTAFRSSKWEILLWSSASCAVTAYHEHFCQPIRKIVESNWTIFPKMGQKNVSQTRTEISTHISFYPYLILVQSHSNLLCSTVFSLEYFSQKAKSQKTVSYEYFTQ